VIPWHELIFGRVAVVSTVVIQTARECGADVVSQPLRTPLRRKERSTQRERPVPVTDDLFAASSVRVLATLLTTLPTNLSKTCT
jgi:hypothetical protein